MLFTPHRFHAVSAPVKWRRGMPLMILAALLTAGCASPTPNAAPNSLRGLPEPDHAAIDKLRQQMALESKKLLSNQDELKKEIRKELVSAEIKPLAPRLDPLEASNISLTMSNASISNVLLAFADQANLNLIVDPAVLKEERRADMYLRKVSLREGFNEVLRAFDVLGEIKGRTVRVSLNEEKMFSLDFLNTTDNLSLSTGGNVFGASAGSAGGGSSNVLTGNLSLTGGGGMKSEPYGEIEAALKTMLGDGKAPASAVGLGAASGTAARGEDRDAGSLFSLNKMTGTVYVKTRPSKMRAVEKMLSRAQTMLRRQVFIEAQLIDVHLSDSFEFGVDWTLLRSNVASGFGTSPMTLAGATSTLAEATLAGRTLTIPSTTVGSSSGPALGLGYQSGSFGIAVNALRSFGNLKVLSNPNVQVRNGTPAMLSVGSSLRYVSRSSSAQTTNSSTATTTTSDVQTDSVFSGVMVGVLPYVREDGRIELLIHPMQSDVDAKSLQLVEVNASNKVTLPVVNYKGISTTLNVGDGDVVMIGGLIDQRNSNSDRGAPGLSDINVFGRLFGNQTQTHSSRELVVILRARVL
ncbi:MAG: pilus (MSHA type) biogenesis protein MshL [Rhodoferax sp.]|uniref:pilus (MSHA type) biogenesis protein MshL n=1 Tax=Rhodoferax sp. TaxID=50421 RepID=UPI00260B5F72|nr:pilus (MSHA type) biogenesis protein MshL [Rhodoferax sp.]MDD5333136.1 pilus (MSHA type) biogenesis protein MshL [Rhodoferax sp.]